MITVPELAAEALGSFLATDMQGRFGSSHARLAELVPSLARLALECIGNSDALYHNVEHTMLVTLAGHDIMKGRALLVPVQPDDYAHFIAGCLMHDIGYVRGILDGDDEEGYVIDATGRKAVLPRGSSDAALLPYHVDRSKLFVMDRLGASNVLTPPGSRTRSNLPAFPRYRRQENKKTKKACCCEPPTSSASLAIRTICERSRRCIMSLKKSA